MSSNFVLALLLLCSLGDIAAFVSPSIGCSLSLLPTSPFERGGNLAWSGVREASCKQRAHLNPFLLLPGGIGGVRRGSPRLCMSREGEDEGKAADVKIEAEEEGT